MTDYIAFAQSDTAVSAQDQRLSQSLITKPWMSPATNYLTRIDGRGGVWRQPNGLVVTAQGSPNMTVKVDRGMCKIPGREATNQGNYDFAADAFRNLNVTAAHATLYRKDAVVVRVKDTQYAGGDGSFGIYVVPGTPDTQALIQPPSDSTIGGSFIVLAYITVRPGTTSILSSDIEDRRHWLTAPGGIEVARSFETSETGGTEGDWRDIGTYLQRHNGTAFVNEVALDNYETWTPVWPYAGAGAVGAGTLSHGNGTNVGRFTQTGKKLQGYAYIGLGTAGENGGAGTVSLTLPGGFVAAGTGRQMAGSAGYFHVASNV